MKMSKPSEAVKKTFEACLPDDSRVERRQMFGMPCAFVNGNMFCGIFQEDVMVRLSDDQRKLWVEKRKARLFEPMPGRPMKEYIEVPKDVLKDQAALKALINQSFNHLLTLKPKEKKKKNTVKKPGVSKNNKKK